MKKYFTPTLLLATLLVAASNSHALLITDSKSFSNSNVQATAGYTTGSASRSNSRTTYTTLSGFDSTLGTLQSVQITYNTTSHLYGRLDVYDPSTCSIFCEDNVRGYGSVNSTNRIDLLTPNLGGTPSNYEGSSLGCRDDDGRCVDTDHSWDYAFDGTLYQTNNTAYLNAFLDTDVVISTYNYIRSRVTNCYDSEDKCKTYGDSDFWGNLSIAYNYEAFPVDPVNVPEPSSLALVALGLLGFRASRKGKR